MASSRVVIPSPLGALEIVTANDAITALNWTDDDRISHAPNLPLLQAASRQLSAYFDDPKQTFDLPLAPEGEPFEQAVWREMLSIPSGMTCTYGDIAKTLAKPAQAVGGACGRNPIPVIIPCHRVVGAGDRLTGYSGKGGVETKRWLLQHEGALLI